MNANRVLSSGLLVLAPILFLARPGVGRAAEPPLHVDPTVEECSIRFAPGLTQASFERFVREFGSVSAFKLAGGPTTLGRNRVSVGLEGMQFTVEDHSDAWNDTFVHPDASHDLGSSQLFPKLRMRVGVADALDLGAFFARNFDANYGWVGFDLRYAALRQGPQMPVTLAVRGAWTHTLYVDDMQMNTFTSDFVIGRTFGGTLTPYVAAGSDLVLARETSDAVRLSAETQSVSHWLAGVEYRIGHLGLGAEAGRGDLTSVQVHVSALY